MDLSRLFLRVVNFFNLYSIMHIIKIKLRSFFKSKRMNALTDSMAFYKQFVKPGSVVFDVGANIGDKTEMFLAAGAKSVVAVEPQKRCVKVLRSRFKKNGAVSIIDSALGSDLGTANLHICDYASGISTLSTDFMTKTFFASSHDWKKVQQVSVTTLDSLIEQYGVPSFCKIDVEGFEYSVLSGLSKKISYIEFEFLSALLDNVKKCLDHIMKIGSARFNFSTSNQIQFYFEEWVSAEKLLTTIEELSSKNKNGLQGDIYVSFD